MHVCVFNYEKDRENHSRQSHPKSIHYVPPHVLSMNTTCRWSTARKIRLSKSLVASLQCTSLAACLSCSPCVCSCTNTHINTHIKPHTCSGQHGTPSFKYSSRLTDCRWLGVTFLSFFSEIKIVKVTMHKLKLSLPNMSCGNM